MGNVLKARFAEDNGSEDLYAGSNISNSDIITILKVSQAISSTLHSRDVMDIIVKSVAEIIGAARCSLVKLSRKDRFGHVLATHEDPKIKDIPIDLGKYPEIKRVIEVNGPVIINDIHKEPLLAEIRDCLKGVDFKTLLLLPITIREEAVGIFILRASRKKKKFTQRELNLCQIIANLAGNALVNAHLFESMELANLELERLSITDGLTGAYNHRYFKIRLEDEFNRARRYGTPLSCIMLDIDWFKDINDTFGHARGDIVLKEIAELIKGKARKTDIVARYGGEEFVVLLPQTDRNGAFVEAERIRNAVKNHRCAGKDRCIMLTISLGVSTFPSRRITTPDRLLGKADEALYRAKKSGRDATVAM